jgi:putative DNA primase/helicase
LGALLAENPNGLLHFRDELMGFLRSLEREGHENDRSFYLEAWNGTGSYSYDRIARGTLFIPSVTVSVLGGIQPSRLAAYIRSKGSGENDDGLIARFQLAVYPEVDQPYVHVDRRPDTDAKNRAYQVFQVLDTLDLLPLGAKVDEGDAEGIPYLRFAEEAQTFFDGWFIELESRLRSSQEMACLLSHLAKYRSLMPSLALQFHLIEVVDGMEDLVPGEVSLRSARRAAAWCDYLEHHAKRIYFAAFEGDPEPAQRLAERLKASLPNPFAPYQVVQKGWRELDTIGAVERAIALLEARGWIYRHEVLPGPKGGRPKIEIHLNPRLLKEEPN